MTIRDATESDIPALSKLAQETYIATFGHTMSEDELTEVLKTRSEDYFHKALHTDTILVAEEESTIVGFIQFGAVTIETTKATDQDIELHKIYIDKNQQGKGIGKKLMKSMFEHSRLDKIENIYLDVYGENEKAISFYEKYGFKVIGKTPFKADGKIVGNDLVMKYSKNTF